MRYFITWFALASVFLAIDSLWLGFVAKSFYQRHIGFLLREEFLTGVAALFYLFYSFCLLVLVVVPAAKSGSPMQAVLLGALLGLCAYGTYDITNLATIKGWPVIVTIVDMGWGMTLTAITSLAGYMVLSRLPV